MKLFNSTSKVFTIILLIYLCFPILKGFARSTEVVFLLVSLLVLFFTRIKFKHNNTFFIVLLFVAPYLASFISLAYSSNISHGLSELGRTIVLLIFPILFYLCKDVIQQKQIKFLVHFFSIIILFYLTYVLILYLNSPDFTIEKFHGIAHIALRHAFEFFSGHHPAYLGMYLSFILVFYVIVLIENWPQLNTIRKTAIITAISYSMLLMLILAVKMAIISSITTAIIISFILIKRKKIAIIASLSILVFLSTAIVFIPTLNERYQHLKDAITEKSYKDDNPDSMRFVIYDSSFSIIKQHILLGVGIGDSRDALLEQYKIRKNKRAIKTKFSTHNQFMHYWLSTGLLGLLLFILSLVCSIILAIKYKNYYYFGFLLIAISSSLTEDILQRQSGLYFFAFFNSLFAFNLQSNKSNTLYINARFVNQPLSGVQRFAYEISKNLQKLHSDIKFVSYNKKQHYKDLPLTRINLLKGHLWEQISLPLYLLFKGNPTLINLGNTGPLFYAPKIVTVHDISFKTNPKWFSKQFSKWYNFIVPRICKNSLLVLTVSNFSKNEISKYYNIQASKIKVIYNGISEDLLNKSDNIEQKPLISGKYILSVGTISERKNQNTIIQAFEKLKIENVKLVLAGADIPNIYNENSRLKSQKNVEFVNYPSDEELVNLYSNAEFTCYIPHYEGFGLPILESFFFKKPTIASDIPVFRELFQKAVIFVDRDNIKELSETFSLLIDNQNDYSEIVQSGTEYLKKYSYLNSAKELLDEFFLIEQK